MPVISLNRRFGRKWRGVFFALLVAVVGILVGVAASRVANAGETDPTLRSDGGAECSLVLTSGDERAKQGGAASTGKSLEGGRGLATPTKSEKK